MDWLVELEALGYEPTFFFSDGTITEFELVRRLPLRIRCQWVSGPRRLRLFALPHLR